MRKNPESEKALLAGILISEGGCMDAVQAILGSDGAMFSERTHALIYEASCAAHKKTGAVDAVLLCAELGPKISECGGTSYLSELLGVMSCSALAPDHARDVAEAYSLRRLENKCREVVQSIESGDSASDVLAQAESSIFDVVQNYTTDEGPAHVATEGDAVLEYFKALGSDPRAEGIPSGIGPLDGCLGGLRDSEMIVLAARPSVGKTALALNFAAHVAIKEQVPSLFFSLEMSKQVLARRMVSIVGAVDPLSFKQQFRLEHETAKAEGAVQTLADAPLFVDDAPARTLAAIRSEARRWQTKHGKGIIIIDYLQLIRGSSKARREQRYVEVGDISRGIKALARELACPVILLAQLSRSAEQCKDGFQMLAHLRESGDIEADADAVIILHRLSEEDRKKLGSSPHAENIIKLTLAKNRNGPIGAANLYFDKGIQTFSGLDGVGQNPPPTPKLTAYEGDEGKFDEFVDEVQEEALF
jgi:replicative DNA helicase